MNYAASTRTSGSSSIW